MTVTDVRQLAGVSFLDTPPASPRVLPRMDVVGFVGFARTGPLDTPVLVESVEDFRRLFGGEVELAWDDVGRQVVVGQLAGAVRDFFVNGGTRAWVVRVAGTGVATAQVPLPGVLAVGTGRNGAGLRAAGLLAASPGTAGEAVGLAVAVAVDRLEVLEQKELSPDDLDRKARARRSSNEHDQAPQGLVELVVRSAREVVAGDLLRLAPAASEDVYVAVTEVRAQPAVPTRRSGGQAAPTPGQLVTVSAPLLALGREAAVVVNSGDVEIIAPGADALVVVGEVVPGASRATLASGSVESVRVTVAHQTDLPQVGCWLRLPGWVHAEGASTPSDAWVLIEEVEPPERIVAGTLVRYAADVHGRVALPRAPLPQSAGAVPVLPAGAVVERLTLEVHADVDGGRSSLAGLGLLPTHPRYVGTLPDLARRLRQEPHERHQQAAFEDLTASVFPWAGADSETAEPGTALLPVLADEAMLTWVRPLRSGGSPAERNGLASLDAHAFLDKLLLDNGVDTLVGHAEDLRWRGALAHRLRGIHALLPVDEVTVISVPDAAHRGWQAAAPPPVRVPAPAAERAGPEPCDHGDFDECAPAVVPPTPAWEPYEQLGDVVLLSWDPEPGGPGEQSGVAPTFRVEESVDPTGWEGARAVYVGSEPRVFVPAASPVPRYLRVRAELDGEAGPWSDGLGLPASSGQSLVVVRAEDFHTDVLADVQTALLRMCAARGDLLAVLSVPEHFRAAQIADHLDGLTRTPDPAQELIQRPRAVAPLGPWEAGVPGYGAVYHPWLVHGTGSAGRPVTGVPDGAVAGVLAARARNRGAWVAPANERLREVVALAHEEPLPARQVLRSRQVNVVLRSREDFLCLSEDTLGADPDLRPVNVRRLHSLLRRVLLLEGPHYVFEPHDPVLRRGIERGFTELMRFLHSLGAFAGRSAGEAFRVWVSEAANPPSSVDAGRLVVEIAYAPSRPLEFVRVRLVHAGEPGFRLVDS